MAGHPTRRYTRDYRAQLAGRVYDQFDSLSFALGDLSADGILQLMLECNEDEGFDFAFSAPHDHVLRVEGVHFTPEFVRAVYAAVAAAYPEWPEGME